MQEKVIHIVREWDPYGYGADFYETEPVDVLQALYEETDAHTLGRVIQRIYHQSFGEHIDQVSCFQLAQRLLLLKEASHCELP
ncbi:DUF1871 family protein [Litoribacterium kuwaitense]|uniref:DUF1871 family protein n=1 Tax=Litoribacterium kuwaitense TaxID=1398745 RepID=UPI001FE27FCD|nr:DUF1871 family protein [Litoribacterium kuwaitense]